MADTEPDVITFNMNMNLHVGNAKRIKYVFVFAGGIITGVILKNLWDLWNGNIDLCSYGSDHVCVRYGPVPCLERAI
jgi:hypothetical protein